MSVVSPRLVGVSPSSVVGAGDPESSRLVYAMVVGLVLVGVALILLAVWIMRQTRPDLEVLAPLERMGDGDWRKRDPSTQRRMLDEVRPEGAEPLTLEPMPPPIDAEFEQSEHPVSSFSDLGPGVSSDQRDPTPSHPEILLDLEPLDAEIVAEADIADGEIDATDDEDDATTDGEDDVDDIDGVQIEAGPDPDEALSDPRG